MAPAEALEVTGFEPRQKAFDRRQIRRRAELSEFPLKEPASVDTEEFGGVRANIKRSPITAESDQASMGLDESQRLNRFRFALGQIRVVMRVLHYQLSGGGREIFSDHRQ